MREIKFRAWDKNSGMYEVNSIGFDNCLEHTVIYGTHMGHLWTGSRGENKMTGSTVDCILMQYTGLKDKNGKEIYEGDILLADNDYVDEGNLYLEVKWNDKQTGYYLEDAKHGIDCDVDEFEMIDQCYQVIGNIYETPELLK
jgi:uncharacterized phage protein (TIGR01671 family)